MEFEQIKTVINNFVDFILNYAITLAAIGGLSMALIEALKSIFSWRDRWHRWKVCDWIQGMTIPVNIFAKLNIPSESDEAAFHHTVYTQLILLTTGQNVPTGEMGKGIELLPWSLSESNALFALELEKLMGQIQDAADMALAHPHHYSALYLFLTAGGDSKDIAYWYECARNPPVSTQEDMALAKQQADTYSRLRQFIRRRLDAFQLATSYQWQTLNQIVSVALGSVLLFASLVFISKESNWIGLAVISLIGGIVAPVAKDLVMALKRVRSGD